MKLRIFQQAEGGGGVPEERKKNEISNFSYLYFFFQSLFPSCPWHSNTNEKKSVVAYVNLIIVNHTIICSISYFIKTERTIKQ